MTERRYPEQSVGSFPEPPRSITDREGREIDLRGHDPGTDAPEALVAMYDAFDPADRAQGIPPSGEAEIRRWVEDLFATGYNVVARHGETVAGHATLVPEATDPGLDSGADDGDGRATSAPHELAIFVLQSYQGAGIGKALLRTLLGFGAARGVERVWLTVEQWNRPAIGLYEDVGFETVGTQSFEREMSIRIGADAED